MRDPIQLDRGQFIRALGAAGTLAAAGCTTTATPVTPTYARAYSRKPWVAPRVSMDTVIRVVVGHRPFRPQGFRVEREQLDAFG